MSEFHGYVTVTVVDPTGSVETVSVALPLLSSTVPSTVFPAVKVTGPVGVAVGEVIFAMKVTTSPTVDGLGDELMVAALVVCCTTWFRMGEALGPLFVSPTYTAISGYRSALRFDLVSVATPLALSVTVPMELLPQLKFTFPVGVVAPDVVTVAVQVMVCP